VIKKFTDAGGIFVAAAGNAGSNNDTLNTFPCNFNRTNPNVICVAASNAVNQLADFSNYGQNVDIAAP
jgi:hypothetical protein